MLKRPCFQVSAPGEEVHPGKKPGGEVGFKALGQWPLLQALWVKHD